MALEQAVINAIRKPLGRLLVKNSREVLEDRTHIKTGALRRSLRWRPLKLGVRLDGLFYGEILQARKLEMKKVPPGPRAEGWIEEGVRRTIEEFNDTELSDAASATAVEIKRIFLQNPNYRP